MLASDGIESSGSRCVWTIRAPGNSSQQEIGEAEVVRRLQDPALGPVAGALAPPRRRAGGAPSLRRHGGAPLRRRLAGSVPLRRATGATLLPLEKLEQLPQVAIGGALVVGVEPAAVRRHVRRGLGDGAHEGVLEEQDLLVRPRARRADGSPRAPASPRASPAPRPWRADDARVGGAGVGSAAHGAARGGVGDVATAVAVLGADAARTRVRRPRPRTAPGSGTRTRGRRESADRRRSCDGGAWYRCAAGRRSPAARGSPPRESPGGAGNGPRRAGDSRGDRRCARAARRARPASATPRSRATREASAAAPGTTRRRNRAGRLSRVRRRGSTSSSRLAAASTRDVVGLLGDRCKLRDPDARVDDLARADPAKAHRAWRVPGRVEPVRDAGVAMRDTIVQPPSGA